MEEQRIFHRHCFTIHDEFMPSFTGRVGAHFFAKRRLSNPWKTQSQELIRELDSWPQERIDLCLDNVYKFFLNPLRRQSAQDKILFGSQYIATNLNSRSFLDHAILLTCFFRHDASVFSMLYLDSVIPRNILKSRLRAWRQRFTQQHPPNPLITEHIEVLNHVIANVDTPDLYWYNHRDFVRRIYRLRKTRSPGDFAMLYSPLSVDA